MTERHSKGGESDWKQGRKVGAVCLSQREKHHARFLHRQKKIRKKECHRPFDNARQPESDKRPKKEAQDPQHVRSHKKRR